MACCIQTRRPKPQIALLEGVSQSDSSTAALRCSKRWSCLQRSAGVWLLIAPEVCWSPSSLNFEPVGPECVRSSGKKYWLLRSSDRWQQVMQRCVGRRG
jgi:hypothetical protein